MSTSAASVGKDGRWSSVAGRSRFTTKRESLLTTSDKRPTTSFYSGGVMIHRFLLCMFLFSLVVSLSSSAQPEQSSYDGTGESWSWGFGSEEGGGGSSYLGVDIADVSPERLGELKLKEEHGAEVTMV